MSDFLAFKVVPVAGYDDIVAANDKFLQGQTQVNPSHINRFNFNDDND